VARRTQRIGVMKNGRLSFAQPARARVARAQATAGQAAAGQAAGGQDALAQDALPSVLPLPPPPGSSLPDLPAAKEPSVDSVGADE
jgi:hypothetical protein